MATTLKPAEPLPAEKSPRRFAWPVFWTVTAVLIFVLYQFILPEASSDVRTWFREWLPLTSLNEALVYAMLAIGLNIVVGYAVCSTWASSPSGPSADTRPAGSCRRSSRRGASRSAVPP
jgi:hypothetical protein